jgi:hypothetical protein
MRFSPHFPAGCLFLSTMATRPARAQKEVANPQTIASAKTIYFDEKSGVAGVGKKALDELSKWGRFEIVQDRKKTDLILVLSADPNQGGKREI